MPITTQERAEINRRNASKSTGPRTEAGKAASRRNALKHGLAATTIAPVEAPGEPPGAYQARLDLFLADTDPRNVLELVMIERACRASWKLDRVARYEDAAAAVRQATPDADRLSAGREAESLGRTLMYAIDRDGDDDDDDNRAPSFYKADDAAERADAADALGRSPEGVAWLLDQWSGVLPALPREGGPPPEGAAEFLRRSRRRACRLLGISTGLPVSGQPLRDASEAEVRRLTALLVEMSAAESDRTDADLSLFADSPDAQLLMRYEAQAERDLHRAVNTFIKLRQNPELVPPPDVAPAPAPVPAPDGAVAAPAEVKRPAPRTEPPPAPNEANPPAPPRRPEAVRTAPGDGPAVRFRTV